MKLDLKVLHFLPCMYKQKSVNASKEFTFSLIIKNSHSQLAQAQRVFHQFARGPACEKYLKQLEQSCEKFWRNGRQLCEEVSILSNHCVNPVSQNYSY